MSIHVTCENCGKPIDRYEALYFKIDYIEEYLCDYFKIGTDILYNKQQFAGDNKTTIKICFYMISKYTSLNNAKLSSKYKRHPDSIRQYLKSVDTRNSDFIFIDKELSGQLDINKHTQHD